MPDAFDPYNEWLGIPPEDQPPHHYQLLGIDLFEDDGKKIAHAALSRTETLRTYQLGSHFEASQQLLNQVAQAKLCLLAAERKAAYDAALKQRLSPAEAPAPTATDPAEIQRPQPTAEEAAEPIRNLDSQPEAEQKPNSREAAKSEQQTVPSTLPDFDAESQTVRRTGGRKRKARKPAASRVRGGAKRKGRTRAGRSQAGRDPEQQPNKEHSLRPAVKIRLAVGANVLFVLIIAFSVMTYETPDSKVRNLLARAEVKIQLGDLDEATQLVREATYIEGANNLNAAKKLLDAIEDQRDAPAKAEAEQKAKKIAVRKAEEEAQRRAKIEEKQKAKAEREAKEEAERKAMIEAQQRAKEEKEEAERKAMIEAQQRAKEEKEEAERKAMIEAQQRAKEEAAAIKALEKGASPAAGRKGNKLAFPRGQWVDVLGRVDVNKHALEGHWTKRGRDIVVNQRKTACRLIVPVAPVGDYDFEIQFSRLSGIPNNWNTTVAVVPIGSASCGVWFNTEGPSGIDMIYGRRPSDSGNPTSLSITMKNNRRHIAVISVRYQRNQEVTIRASLDRQVLFVWNGPVKAVSLRPDWGHLWPSTTLGLGAFCTQTVFHSARLRVVSGEAHDVKTAF